MSNVFFLLARGVQPNLTMYQSGGSSRVAFYPRLSPSLPYVGANGTLVDQDGMDYYRPYHRILVPANASTTTVDGKPTGTQDWFVTVANMEPRTLSLYSIRVSCVTEAAVPCPQPAPGAQQCNGKGTCGVLPGWAGPARPALNKVCYCSGDWGDFACQTPVKRMELGAVDSAVLAPQAWAFWQVTVPRPPAGYTPGGTAPPALLVEMSRTYAGPGPRGPSDTSPYYFGNASAADPVWREYWAGDPILVLMPKGVNDSNRLPSWGDVKAYGDLKSYLLEQNLHYILYRDLPVTFPDASDAGKYDTSEFYVAVVNDDQEDAVRAANITLRVRWRTDTTQSGPLCPGDCFGRGLCYDPQDLAARAPPPLLPASPDQATSQADFQCACQTGFGGLLCEGPLSNLTISTSGSGGQGTLQPGQWTFFVMNIDSRRFDYRSNDINIQWVARDGSGDAASQYSNAFVTIDMQAFPRGPQPQTTDGYRLGWQVYYSTLTQSSNSPQPMLLRGTDLRPGYTYVLGMYNSDYRRQYSYDYGMWMFVPTSSRTWLHPYMSVVLGVTASIIICLLLTLCRRLVQRYGWGPFRSREEEVRPAGHMATVQVGPARPRGVPGSTIDSFFSYDYTASKAEKQQLARSNWDKQLLQQQQKEQEQQQPGQDSAQRPGSPGRGGAPAASAAEGGVGADDRMETPAAVAAAAAAVPAPPPDAVVVDVRAAGAATATDSRPSTARAVLTRLTVPPVAPVEPAVHGASEPAGGGGVVGGGAGANTGTSSSAAGEEEEPQCTVCLCEYEEGERITRLPCNHEFHCTCITKWLQTHYTCPICRVSLLPEESELPPGNAPDGTRGASGSRTESGAAAQAGAVAAGAGAAATQLTSGDRRPSRRRSHSLSAVPGAIPPAAAGDGRSAPVPPGVDGAAARAPPASPPAGLMGRVFGSLRRGAASNGGSAAPAADANAASPAGSAVAMQTRRRSDTVQVPTRGSSNQLAATPPRGVTESLSSGENSPAYVATAAPAQVLAHGPTATLESPAAAAGAASGTRSPSAQARRTGSARVAALPPAADVDVATPPTSPLASSLNRWTAAPIGVLRSPAGGSAGGGVRDAALLTPPQPSAAATWEGSPDHPLAPSPTRLGPML